MKRKVVGPGPVTTSFSSRPASDSFSTFSETRTIQGIYRYVSARKLSVEQTNVGYYNPKEPTGVSALEPLTR